jgi:tagatose-6-phosphate ketose/aldose isomerase
MLYAALAALSGIEAMTDRVERMALATEHVIATQAGAMRTLAANGYERVVYLGSHLFKGLAREAALKLTELTDGAMIAVFDSLLGFRHGPKTVVNEKTLVVIFLSNHAYTRRYDLDLLDELRRDRRHGALLVISAQEADIAADVDRIFIPAMHDADDVDLLIPFIAAPQIFAFESSLARGLSPDSPNKSGTVNRVVQGVRIHPFSP